MDKQADDITRDSHLDVHMEDVALKIKEEVEPGVEESGTRPWTSSRAHCL